MISHYSVLVQYFCWLICEYYPLLVYKEAFSFFQLFKIDLFFLLPVRIKMCLFLHGFGKHFPPTFWLLAFKYSVSICIQAVSSPDLDCNNLFNVDRWPTVQSCYEFHTGTENCSHLIMINGNSFQANTHSAVCSDLQEVAIRYTLEPT